MGSSNARRRRRAHLQPKGTFDATAIHKWAQKHILNNDMRMPSPGTVMREYIVRDGKTPSSTAREKGAGER